MTCFQALYNSFLLYETVCIGCGINEPNALAPKRELEALCRDVSKDGVSLVAKCRSNGKVIGVAFNKIQV